MTTSTGGAFVVPPGRTRYDSHPYGVLYGWDIWVLQAPERGICLAAVRAERMLDSCTGETDFIARGVRLTLPNPYSSRLAPYRDDGGRMHRAGRNIRFAPEDMTVRLLNDAAAPHLRETKKGWSLGESNP